MNEPKYQWSVFPNDSKGEQFVVRTDNFNELLSMIGEIKDYLDIPMPKKPEPESTPKEDYIDPNGDRYDTNNYQGADWCRAHNKKMKERTSGGETFYSHARLNQGEWEYCSGRGFKSKSNGSMNSSV